MTMYAIAGGRPGLDYQKVFLDHDVMLIGWASKGEYDPYRYPVKGPDNGQVRRFVTRPKPGDVIILRYRQDAMCAGLIPPDPDGTTGYKWRPEFGDVLGWNGSHTRRVVWDPETQKILQSVNPAWKNPRQSTFMAVHLKELVGLEEELRSMIEKNRGSSELAPLPTEFEDLSDSDLGIALFEEGLANDSVERVRTSIHKARRLAAWYDKWSDSAKKEDRRPTEHEVVSHVLIPLFLALGWSEQLVAVEWNKIDIAFFSKTPTEKKCCVAICEAKLHRDSLQEAFSKQAFRYVHDHSLEQCKTILTSDGRALYLYKRKGSEWSEDQQPDGYVNLMHIRRRHLMGKDLDAVKTLIDLTPFRIAARM